VEKSRSTDGRRRRFVGTITTTDDLWIIERTQTRPAEMTFDDSLELDDDIVLRQLRDLTTQIRSLSTQLEKKVIKQVRGSPTSDARRVRFYDKPRRPARYNSRQREAGKDTSNNDQRIEGQQQTHANNNQLRLRQQEKADCSRCGHEGGHDRQTRCNAYNKLCYHCSKIGHLARCCFWASNDRKSRTQAPDQE